MTGLEEKSVRLFESDEEREQYMSTLSDPFNKESITSVTLWIRRGWSNRNFEFTADIDFKNGPTRGKHEIKGEDFKGLVTQVEQFLKHL